MRGEEPLEEETPDRGVRFAGGLASPGVTVLGSEQIMGVTFKTSCLPARQTSTLIVFLLLLLVPAWNGLVRTPGVFSSGNTVASSNIHDAIGQLIRSDSSINTEDRG